MISLVLTALSTRPNFEMNAAAVQRLVSRCQEAQSCGLVVMKDGKVVLERNFGFAQGAANLMSATKSVTSIAIGMLLDEGKLASVDTPLAKIFPNYKGKWKDQVTVRNLLEHASGIRTYEQDGSSMFPKNRVASALAAPVVTEPGTRFEYNNRGADLLSGLVRKLAGVPMDQYLKKRLFDPLGIKDWYWMRDPDGNPHGCAELVMDAKNFAKIGQMMLDGGAWQGRRILSQSYVEHATRAIDGPTSKSGWARGWLWWVCDPWFTFTDASIAYIGRQGVSQKALDRLKVLRNQVWPNYRELGFDVIHTGGGYEEFSMVPEADWSELQAIRPGGAEETGFYANGWGGQWLLVLPKQHVVAVRLGKRGFFEASDSTNYEMGDFYRLVRDLFKAG